MSGAAIDVSFITVGRTVRVESSYPTPMLAAQPGSLIEILYVGAVATGDSEWFFGTSQDGAQGWFPMGFVVPLQEDQEEAMGGTHQPLADYPSWAARDPSQVASAGGPSAASADYPLAASDGDPSAASAGNPSAASASDPPATSAAGEPSWLQRRGGDVYCTLCSDVATQTHLFSEEHRRRVEDLAHDKCAVCMICKKLATREHLASDEHRQRKLQRASASAGNPSAALPSAASAGNPSAALADAGRIAGCPTEELYHHLLQQDGLVQLPWHVPNGEGWGGDCLLSERYPHGGRSSAIPASIQACGELLGIRSARAAIMASALQ